MESRRLCLALFILLSVTLSAEANQYFVGGSKEIGWNDKPKKESYNHWSKNTRFAVNDTIGKDTVLYVREDDYKKCDNKNPVKTWDDGYTEVNLFRTGIYHFIGGNDGSCHKGQRLIVFVPEVQPPAAHTPAAAPWPCSPPVPSTAPPPAQQPPWTAHTPVPAPWSLSPPVPSTPSPAQQPPSPAAHTPATAPWSSPPVPSTPPPAQSPPSPQPSILQPPKSSPSPAATPTTSGPSAYAPQPWWDDAPAPAPSSAWSIAARSILLPVVGVLFGILFY